MDKPSACPIIRQANRLAGDINETAAKKESPEFLGPP